MKLTKLLLVLTAFGALTIASDSRAATTKTTTFLVTAHVVPNCTISAADMNFGDYDPLSPTDKTTSGQVTITCTNGATVTVGLSGGDNLDAGLNRMKSASTGGYLQYLLYQDSPPTIQWSDSQPAGSGHVKTITTATLSPVPYTIYGVAPKNQPLAKVATDYTDTVTASVNF